MFSLEQARQLNAQILSFLADSGTPITDSAICPHHPEGTVEEFTKISNCRKPAPGMLLELSQKHPIDLEESWIVGDKLSDAETGKSLGVKGALVNTGGKTYTEDEPYPVFENLLAFARYLETKQREL